MEFGPGTYAISLAAGSLSTLSPCVLPLLPILIGSAVAAHRHGPWALAVGVMLSFALLGVVLARAAAATGLDPAALRNVAAVILVFLGVVLLSPFLQQRFAVAASGVSSAGDRLIGRLTLRGLGGQFVLGLLLGLVWSPCVGPTLGAAITLASQGEHLTQVALVMALFGFGAALPLAAFGIVTRSTMQRLRGRLWSAGRGGRRALGAVMLTLGVLMLAGLDKRVEAWLIDVAPAWWTEIGTSL